MLRPYNPTETYWKNKRCPPLWEYDTENHIEKFNHTDTPLKPHWKGSKTIITLNQTEICQLLLFSYSRKLSPYNPTEKNSSTLMSFVLSIIFSVTLRFQCDFQCHILMHVLCSVNFQRYSAFSVWFSVSYSHATNCL